jgi:hypothetical protein
MRLVPSIRISTKLRVSTPMRLLFITVIVPEDQHFVLGRTLKGLV